ncbi:homoserine kinase [Polymorphobacter multimanifer]|uniref:Homoserine kinase n=1 Tax=Polymorphobacter multimanifer TaxID=1070431 RepID=A0A841L5F4_9SPHN|nr:homoserine kinase [Polymorphobacter multimanifer]MBB6228129.1 homoserine kinase type II [Polymorphobacter multimanifer]GGI69882.1 homoserine kinase [Polymorphobacter multimanifer]
MAVYTQVSAEALAGLLSGYDLGDALSFKGIAEGVQNSNYLLETSRGRFILTLYEHLVDHAALPWFLALTTHFADAGLPVPRPVRDRQGEALQTLLGRPAAIIEFVSGVSVSTPTPAQAQAAGAALGRLHGSAPGFGKARENDLGQPHWPAMAARCLEGAAAIDPQLPALIEAGLRATRDWPAGLPTTEVHTDLFPDNVLMLGDTVTGLIDFYFAATDLVAYDYAVTHAAWCFSADGRDHDPALASALAAGHAGTRGLSADEIAALPQLGVGAALRFTLTRTHDWLNTPADALVTRKDPMAFARRLAWYLKATPNMVLGR